MRLLLAAVTLTLVACQAGPSTLTVYNNTTRTIAARFEANGETREWLLAPQRIEILIRTDGPLTGRLTAIDALTCQIVGVENVENGRAILAMIDPASDGRWVLEVVERDPDEAGDAPAASPNAPVCGV